MARLLHNGQYNFDSCIAMTVLATAAVALRFVVRIRLKHPISLAEWFCVAGLILFYAYVGAITYYIVRLSPNGNGNFDVLQFASPFELRPLLRILFISEVFFSVSITAVKISILCFYHQIFTVSTRFRRATYAAILISIIWLATVLPVIIFQCHPIKAFWDDLSSPKFCRSSATILLGYEVSNLLVDVLILLLPVFMVRTLHLPTSRKLSVIAIFLLGGVVCIASVIRVTRIWRPPMPDVNIHLPTVIMWSTIQIGLAIVCACLPTYGPILKSAMIKSTCQFLLRSFRSSFTSSTFGFKRKSKKSTLLRENPEFDLEMQSS